ncbi:MAG TPA: 1,2-phenylacetyl-CoA epoxidase subunit PaaD [Candidatus Limnocylindrales bacterium]|nr:1,2-phenylacetyl-CoA epoxidase subunit PaaD [Candidatus Limnocylindrales bacterium]
MIAAPAPTPKAVMAALERIADPEIPAVSIVELGMIGDVDVRPDRIHVELVPTFVGCPAVDMIRASIEDRLSAFCCRVDVDVSYATPWSSDRITPAGRVKLRRSGFAAPPPVREGRALPMLDAASVPCPYCGSHRTRLESVFGPTQCRSVRYCADCRQPFEAFKPV